MKREEQIIVDAITSQYIISGRGVVIGPTSTKKVSIYYDGKLLEDMPIQPKSPEQIYHELFSTRAGFNMKDFLASKDFLKNALASFALYLDGKIEEKRKFDCERDICLCEGATADDKVFNYCIDECKSILRREAEEVMKGV